MKPRPPSKFSRRKFLRNTSMAVGATWTMGRRLWAADATPPAGKPNPAPAKNSASPSPASVATRPANFAPALTGNGAL